MPLQEKTQRRIDLAGMGAAVLRPYKIEVVANCGQRAHPTTPSCLPCGKRFATKRKPAYVFSNLRRLTSNAPAIKSQVRNGALPRYSIEFANAAQQLLASSNAPFFLDFAAWFP
jgi:hypothetical protein